MLTAARSRHGGAEYLRLNSDMAESGCNPLIHYERWGREELRLGGLTADPDGVQDIHCSTFHAKRSYPFMAPAALDAVHESYLRKTMSRGAPHPAGSCLQPYLRQFSYAAARGDFALMLNRVQAMEAGPLPAASAFARHFEEFRRTVAGDGGVGAAVPPRAVLGQPRIHARARAPPGALR